MDGMTIDQIVEAIKSQAEKSVENTPTSLTHKCDLCMDTGWVRVDMGNGYTGVAECGCVKARKAEKLMRKSGLADVLDQQTFETFVADTDMQRNMKQKAREYVDHLFSIPADAPRKPWLYIGGNPGSGKTHICTAICGKLLKNNVEVVYMQWLNEARRLKAYTNEPDFDSLVDKYTDCAVLYIDDLFKQTYRGSPVLTDADIKMAFTIFNARYLQNKPTIISSEWSLEELLEADEGVFSRVYERCKEHTLLIPRDARNNYRLARVKGATA